MRRPADHQRENIRGDLHKIVNEIIEHWSTIEQQANDMRAGFPPDTLASGGGTGDLTLVEANAVGNAMDPGWRAAIWIVKLHEFVNHGYSLQDELKKLLPLTDKQKDKLQQRQNNVELCTKCQLPAPKVRRINGEPYHADTCYYQVWRANKRAESEPETDAMGDTEQDDDRHLVQQP